MTLPATMKALILKLRRNGIAILKPGSLLEFIHRRGGDEFGDRAFAFAVCK